MTPPLPRAGPPTLRPPLLSPLTTQFHVVIGSRAEEGQYSLNFHNCYNLVPGREHPFDITVRGAPATGQVHPQSLVSSHPPCSCAVKRKLIDPFGRWED